MGRDVRVSIIGESVLVEGIVVSLEEQPYINIQRIQAGKDDALQLINEFKPDVFIFPLELPGIGEVLSKTRLLPGVRLVGLDIDCNQVLIMDSRIHRATSMEALQELIASHKEDPFEHVGSDEEGQLFDEVELLA